MLTHTCTAMFNKILTVNKNMISSGRKDVALNPADESTLQTLKEALESSRPLPSSGLELVARIVTQWDYSDRLAGLDLLRCMARYPIAAQYTDSRNGSLLDLAISSSVPSDAAPNENAAMMGARLIANVFGSTDGRGLASSQADAAIYFLERLVGIKGSEAIGKFNRNVLIAVTTAAINYSVLVNREKLLTPVQRRRVLVVLGVVLKEQSDSEVLYRALVAMGTILSTSKEEAAGLDVSAWVQSAVTKCSEERVKNVAAECKKIVPR